MKRPLDQLAEIAKNAVGIGDDLIKNTRPQTVTEKSDRDTYTDVDVRIERDIRAYLAGMTPEIGFFGEEEGGSANSVQEGCFWMLDPIDGTANFVHGIPLCAVQLALVCNHEAIVAAIDLPYMDMSYWATKDAGAYSTEGRIRVSATTSISNAIVSIGDYATGVGADKKNRKRIAATAALAERVERVRMFGSAAHDFAWAAEGRTDAAIFLSSNPLDVLPGILIAREAGASVTDMNGDPYSHPSGSIVASTPGVAAEMIDTISVRNSTYRFI